jgi:light-regulated signal transduction histidine kinase (bacteriophytochrome)
MDMRDYVQHLLEPYCDVKAVSDGLAALEAARHFPSDLILSDVMMPKMNGFELLKALRSDSSLQKIPVILLSARAGEEAKVEGLQAGADDYLIKPFSARELLARVKTNLDLHRVRHQETIKELERMVIERTAQLQAVNKELEAFSYSISHDLRAPLRAIDGFSQAIIDEYVDKLDEQGKSYLQRIHHGSQQMAQLIDDMLNLSKLTRGKLNIQEHINLSLIVQDIAAELERQSPERQVEFHIQDNVIVRGDQSLLQSVLQNLLENAWKFTSKHSKSCIEFGTLKQNGRLVCYVRDDGAGFESIYAGKLFGAFQRLHSANEFPGTGIGLASIQRIINRHGGEVWAEAEVEKGATFFFTLGSPL